MYAYIYIIHSFIHSFIQLYVYAYIYNAQLIDNYDFLKLSTGVHKNVRTTLVIVAAKVNLSTLKELIVKSLLDAHTPDGELCFAQLTKRYVGGWFNNYWVEEDTFSLRYVVTLIK